MDYPFVVRERKGGGAFLKYGVPQCVFGFRIVGVELQGAQEAGDRLVKFTSLPKRLTEIAPSFFKVWSNWTSAA